jgi:hypothetical protein
MTRDRHWYLLCRTILRARGVAGLMLVLRAVARSRAGRGQVPW